MAIARVKYGTRWIAARCFPLAFLHAIARSKNSCMREIKGKSTIQCEQLNISNEKILLKLLSVQSLSIQTIKAKIKYRIITR